MTRVVTPLLLALALALPASADSLRSLRADDRLRLKAWITPDRDIVVGQEVRLMIEVSTPRWFAGGTRILLPEIDNVIVLRRNEFASNFSRREAGDTWVVQQWQLELYPQAVGNFSVPPVTLELAVNDAEAGIVKGRVETPALAFTAAIPPGFAASESWLATSELRVTQRFDRELTGLQPGDAFSREIEFRAADLSAMMLPDPHPEGIDGLPGYPDPPELVDRSNRGEAVAIRRQSVVYVVERQGQYRLPEQTWYWWNTRKERIEKATLPAVDIDAGQAAARPASARSLPVIAVQTGALILLTLLVAALVRMIGTRSQSRQRRLLRHAARALRRGERRRAASLLYDWLNTQPEGVDWLSLRNTAARQGGGTLPRAVETLLHAAYSKEPAGQLAVEEASALRLLGHFKPGTRRNRRHAVLRLNPVQPRK